MKFTHSSFVYCLF